MAFGILIKVFLRKRGWLALKLLCFALPVIVFCEFLIYYIVIIQCQWPQVKTETPEGSEQTAESVLKAMFLSDTHLLGEIQGHWLDKLRREWQMERAFQTALWLLQPEVVFILGDIFDEGKWSSSQAWSDDVRRFQSMFRHPSHTELIVIVGNHDIGFHYDSRSSGSSPCFESPRERDAGKRQKPAVDNSSLHIRYIHLKTLIDRVKKTMFDRMTAFKLKRFSQVFNYTSETLVTRKGINFVLVNSVAMEGDGCKICRTAEAKLAELSHKLNCSLQEQSQYQKKCNNVEKLPPSAPILLQHYPLYRRSDSQCTGEDAAPLDKRNDLFKEKYDVLSEEASQKLLWWFQPRLILSGHTHSACEVLHDGKIPEISIPSFSWRNRNNPSFIMGSMTLADFSLYKCFLPFENTVVAIYCAAGAVLMLLIMAHFQPLLIFPFLFVQRLITKHKAV